jgi:phospholipid/cholesterol/gamma-HCH transport system substrate-binding protein
MRRALLVLTGATVLAATLTGCANDTYKVTATFDDVGDLQSRGGVQVADVRVGTIGSIKLTEGFRARVTLSLKRSVHVPKASQALVRTTSLLGEKFIELRPQADPGRGPFLQNGDHITDTAQAPELEFVAQETVTVLGAVTAGDVASLVNTGAEGFGGRGAELHSLIANLADISATLAQRTKTIQALIDGLDKTSGTLAAGSGDIAALLDNLSTTTKVLADNRQRAITALDRLDQLATSQNVILDKYRTNIDQQIKQLSAIVAVAAQNSGEVSVLLDWLDRFFTNVPKAIPGDFTQVYMWAIPCAQDPRQQGNCPAPKP